MSPYSGDGKLYKAVIEKIHRSPTGLSLHVFVLHRTKRSLIACIP